jgi:enoyl-[acyl-carrier protein] reductase I
MLKNKSYIITGIANSSSIAYGVAVKLREQGARLAITYLNDKAERFVRPLAEELGAEIIMPMDVSIPGEVEAVFAAAGETWGQIDGVVHSLAFCPLEDLHASLSDCSRDGFIQALDISCYSFIEMARLAKPLMKEGGSLISFSYLGSAMAVQDYNVMGVAKAALEASTRYLARDLGKQKIRVNCISPGTIATRAASGIKDFDSMLAQNKAMSCDGDLPTIEEVGNAAFYYLSDLSKGVTGTVHYVDHGVCISG